MRLSAVIGLLLVLVACGASAGGRTFTTGTTTVVDRSGLVTGVTDGAPTRDVVTGDLPVVANPNGSLTQIAVYWRNPGCSPGATVDLAGNALELVVRRQPSPSTCGTAPHNDAITLTINRVVDVTSIITKSGD
jgi:hypothetical protein